MDNAAVAAPADNVVAVVKEALVVLVEEGNEAQAPVDLVVADREVLEDKAVNVDRELEDKAVNVDREPVVLADNVVQAVDPEVEALAAVDPEVVADPVDPEVVVNRFTLLLT